MEVHNALEKLPRYLAGYLVLIKAYTDMDFSCIPSATDVSSLLNFLILKIEIDANSKGNCW